MQPVTTRDVADCIKGIAIILVIAKHFEKTGRAW